MEEFNLHDLLFLIGQKEAERFTLNQLSRTSLQRLEKLEGIIKEYKNQESISQKLRDDISTLSASNAELEKKLMAIGSNNNALMQAKDKSVQLNIELKRCNAGLQDKIDDLEEIAKKISSKRVKARKDR